MRFISWNVNGIRAIIKKDFLASVRELNPDVLCLQEIKGQAEDVKTALSLLPEYKAYVNPAKSRKGYSGTAILTKHAPINVEHDMNIEEHDQEGRVIAAEYENYFLVTVYVPNSGSELKRLDYRKTWDVDFLHYLKELEIKKPVILCGDLNVAHQEMDIARAKANYNKSAGYTQVEIDGFQRLLDAGFVDTYRHFYPEEVKYTYWGYKFNARARNVGWRIDYFLISEVLLPHVEKPMIFDGHEGSDHCPVGLDLMR
ncbi:MAG: exodeoxyribonuclease III [Candidatus Cyclobacteriaceae bacterium M2_1C_046]